MGFKLLTGHGTLAIPGIQVVRKRSLDLNEAEPVVIYKVGDDFASIANASRSGPLARDPAEA